MAAVPRKFSPADVNHNAALLWKFPNGPIVAKGDRLEKLAPLGSIWLGRLVFWIRDWWSKGEETKKVSALTLDTFNNMQSLMKQKDSHWHFVDYKGEWMGEELTDFVTYEMLAKRFVIEHPHDPSLTPAAQAIEETFNGIDFTQGIEGVTKEDVIYYKISGTILFNANRVYDQAEGPSLYPDELAYLKQEIKAGLMRHASPEFLTNQIKRRTERL
jgi:hypothetical protein